MSGAAVVLDSVGNATCHYRQTALAALRTTDAEWLPHVPRNWNVVPLKFLCKFINGTAFKPTDWSDTGIPIIRIENLNGGGEFNYFDGEIEPKYHVQFGDLLFGWSGNRGTSFGPFLWQREGLHYLNQHIFKIHGYKCDTSWLYWMLKGVTQYIEAQAHGIIGMVHITRPKLGRIPVPHPPLIEQQAIAQFLNAETKRIDALVSQKNRFVGLLHETRLAVIGEAVTKGIDASPDLTYSGFDWVGQIPKRWSVLPLRRILRRIEQGWSPVADDRPVSDGEWAVLKLSAVSNGRFKPEEHKALPAELSPETRFEVRAGDLLLTRSNTPELVADTCFVSDTPPRLMLCDLIYRLHVDPRMVLPEYLSYWLLATPARFAIERDARGTSGSMVKISQTHIRGWVAAIPPLEEQRRILAHIKTRIAHLDALVAQAHSGINILREYRVALILAAVTGKIDVRPGGGTA